ncbi:uncharacterized protein EV420DRAFT_1509264 [Desarmillaria tabescens]|uniref:Uncharacterized protein n=1 Tax=Armillaria tabescens TaxID=1929756 RepID=A0AA39U2Z7_ARMTA|nr:uncharacterized protein EV420DRAFT_1509264 [Desarmillaria tabescens]KAK0466005.1 hypothetical protein EV420DRAFT_1509264 [Desarmillaria tabescens]
MFVLYKRHESPRLLAATSIILFLLGSIHIALSLRQLLEAFINVPATSSRLYSIIYWANLSTGLSVAKISVYATAVFVQYFVMIWRLYVVWDYNWKVTILPLFLEICQMGTAYTAAVLAAKDLVSQVTFGPVPWSIELALNFIVTAGIAGRLWWMGRQVNALGERNKYLSALLVVVESGAIFAAVTLVMLILLVKKSQLSINGTDISTQLAVLTPLLIIARVGMTMIPRVPASTLSFAYPAPASHAANIELATNGLANSVAISRAEIIDISESGPFDMKRNSK